MLDLIGNIKLKATNDESIEERLKYLLMVINSFSYLSKSSKVYLNVDNSEYIDIIKSKLIEHGFDFELTNKRKFFNEIYTEFMDKSKKKYFQHFEEDHISICNDINYMAYLINKCEEHNVDIIKTSFFEIEKSDHLHVPAIYADDKCKIMRMTPINFRLINKKRQRYYLGTNNIFNKQYAYKYWGRKLNVYPPHKFELIHYSNYFEYTLMLPKKELLCPINDDHSLLNSCYLKRKDIKK